MNRMAIKRKLEACSPVTHSCPECSVPVKCDITLGKSTCWCFDVKPQSREVDWNGLCLCATCLRNPIVPD